MWLFPRRRWKSIIHYTGAGFLMTMVELADMVANMIVSAILARYMSRRDFGSYHFLMSLMVLATLSSIPGLHTTIIRSISRGYHGVYSRGVRRSFYHSLIGSFMLLIFAVYAYLVMHNRLLGWGSALMGLFLPFNYGLDKWPSVLRGQKRFDVLVRYTGAAVLLSGLIRSLVAFFSRGSLLYIILAGISVSALSNAFFSLKIRRYLGNDCVEDGWEGSAHRLSFNNFVSLVYDYADKLLIGLFLGPADLAFYAVAVGMTGRLRIFAKEFVRVIFPDLYRLAPAQIDRRVKKVIMGLTGAVFVLTIILIGLAPYLIRLIYSSKYLDAVRLAQVYMLTIPLSTLILVLTALVVAQGKEVLLIKTQFIGVIFNLALYIIFIPLFGVGGAVISSLIYSGFMILILIYSANCPPALTS